MGVENNAGKLPYYELNFGKLFDKNGNGLIPAALVDFKTERFLMIGYMTEEALKESLRTGTIVFWSRTRQELWYKGKTSGNVFYVRDYFPGCENDGMKFLVEGTGPVCHRGTETCFDQIENGTLKENL